MKILIFNWRDITHPWAGGAEVYIHEIGKRLAKKHEVTLLCGGYKDCKKESVIDNIRIIRKGNRYSLYLYAPIIYLSKLRKKYDIIIDCENGIPFFTPLFTQEPKICVMHHVHNHIFDIEMPFYLALIGKFLETKLMPLVYKNVRFVAVSPSTKKEMINLGICKEKIHLVFNGMNGQFAPDWNKKKENLIVYIGRNKKYKQLEHLIKAFRIVKSDIRDSELIIAGRGDFSDIGELSQILGLKLTSYSDITEDEKLDILQKAKIFVTPSMKEGWGITVIEANKCGTPAIAYNVTGLRDSIRHGYNGLLVKEGDINALANTIIKVLYNEELRNRLSTNAVKWSNRFDWDKSAKEFEYIMYTVQKIETL